MRRIVVCLLIALASASVAARESKLADADGGSCPNRATASVTRTPAPAVAAPAKKTKQNLSPAIGGGGEETRLPSPRWHRFLPGMFR